MTVKGVPSKDPPARWISTIAAARAASLETSISQRAGPPMPKRVCSLNGTFSETAKPGIAWRRESIYPQSNMFPGFPPEALKFLRGLERNNRREWFQPRKEIFETKVKAPMIDLVEAINAELPGFAPEHVNDPKKAIYRIYRDTRFSPDKTPYKTHIAAIFPRRGREKHASAGFYCGVSLEGIEVAGGIYMPGPQELLAIRTWLADRHAEFRKAAAGPRKLMGGLQGESLQRIPKGFD